MLTDYVPCSDICDDYGGTCLDAIDNSNDAGQECTPTADPDDDCSTLRYTEICICSL